MSRKAQLVFVTLATVVAIGLCVRVAGQGPSGSRTGASREVTDMTGRVVRIPVIPRRVLSLCTSATDTLVRLGAADRLAAIDEHGRITPGTDGSAVIGKGSAISREQVLGLGIDLAFVWWYQDDVASTLDDLSVPVVRIRSSRAADVPGMVRFIGRCLGRAAAADDLAREVDAYLLEAPVGRETSRPCVYLELYGPYRTLGRDSYLNDLVELAGGRNVAAGAEGSVLLSSEQLIQEDPDTILFVDEFTTASAIADRPGLGKLSAVRSGRVHPIERRLLIAGASLPAAVAKLRSILEANTSPEGR